MLANPVDTLSAPTLRTHDTARNEIALVTVVAAGTCLAAMTVAFTHCLKTLLPLCL
jgi:hypothetical protein